MTVCILLSQSEAGKEKQEEEEVHDPDYDGSDEACEVQPTKNWKRNYYKINFVDSFQFLPTSLQNLVDALLDNTSVPANARQD